MSDYEQSKDVSLVTLPTDPLLHIFSFLDYRDLTK